MGLVNICSELNNVYDAINRDFYDGGLPPVIITVQSKDVIGSNSFGWACQNKWCDTHGERYCEINISAEYLNRSTYEIIGTLSHEMVHIYCWKNDIRDTSNRGRYHNKAFKTEAEKRGLLITKAPVIGFSVTKLSDTFTEYVSGLKIKDVFDLYRDGGNLSENKQPEKKPRRKHPFYKCPQCGETVRGKEGLLIVCGCCDTDFEYINPEEEI